MEEQEQLTMSIEEAERISKINSASMINISLESKWQEAHNAMVDRSLSKWLGILLSIWGTLAGDVLKGSIEEREKMSYIIALDKVGEFDPRPKGFNDLTPLELAHKGSQYKILCDFSSFLRRLQNLQGKGTAYSSVDNNDKWGKP